MDDLTKWPRLLVTGRRVSEDQANEILIRTDDWWLSTNDRQWEAEIKRIAVDVAGMPVEPRRDQTGYGDEGMDLFREYYAAREAWRKSLGILELGYLSNSRIVSSWIGGPHGWCDWTGRRPTSW